MNVFQYPKTIPIKNSKMILGAFASIHHGHFKLFENLLQNKKNKLIICIIENANEIPNKINKVFSDINSRLEDLSSLGFKNVLKIKFNETIKNTSPEDFINDLETKYNVEQFIVGKDYQYGKNASGNSTTLKKMKPNTKVMNLLKINETKLSTSLLNEMLLIGELDVVNYYLANFLKRKYEIKNNEIVFNNYYSKLHSGIYFANLIMENKKFHTAIHFDLNEKAKIYFLDNDFHNKYISYAKEISIEFISLFKIIVDQEQDFIILNNMNFLRNAFTNSLQKIKGLKEKWKLKK